MCIYIRDMDTEGLPENFEKDLENHYSCWSANKGSLDFVGYLFENVYKGGYSRDLISNAVQAHENWRKNANNAGVLCYRREGEDLYICVVKSRLIGKVWGPPKGKEMPSDEGKIFTTAFREWKEETGYDLLEHIPPKTFVPRTRTNKTTIFFIEWPKEVDCGKIFGFTCDEIEKIMWVKVEKIWNTGDGKYFLGREDLLPISLICFQSIVFLSKLIDFKVGVVNAIETAKEGIYIGKRFSRDGRKSAELSPRGGGLWHF